MTKCEHCYQMFDDCDAELYFTHDREALYVCPKCREELEKIDAQARTCNYCGNSTLNYIHTPRGRTICEYCVDKIVDDYNGMS